MRRRRGRHAVASACNEGNISVKRLADRVALITGASRGIGRAIAESYAREGAKVIVNYASNARAAEAVIAAIKDGGGQAYASQANIVDIAAQRKLFDDAERVFGRLDIVVANAHPGLGHGLITKLSDDAVDQQLAVLKSYVVALQEAGRRVRDGGVIITVSSAATRLALPDVGLYASVKLAIEQLSRTLSRELAPRGVRVLSLAPGLTKTDRMNGVKTSAVKHAQQSKSTTPFDPPADAEVIADAAVFLASSEARWVNTSTLHVNGGAAYAQ